MSEHGPRRLRVIAVGAAVLAMVFALVAVIVVVSRGDEPAKPAAKIEPAPLRDHDVRAADVVRLRYETEAVVETGEAKGLRIKDAALAQSLGLEAGDVITAISGKPVTSEGGARDAVLKLSLMDATMLYVEVTRAGAPTLLRWRLDGDLREARYAAMDSRSSGSRGASSGLGSTYMPPYSARPVNDPLLDTIVKIGDTRYTVPRKTVDAVLAKPMTYLNGARMTPAIRHGQHDGLKLYAIRPSSVFHKAGFMNGDTVHTINGMDIADAKTVRDIPAKLVGADEIEFELTRRGRPMLLTIQITK